MKTNKCKTIRSHFTSKIIPGLLMAFLIIASCSDQMTTQIDADESERLQETLESFTSSRDERPMRMPGQVNGSKLTDLIREILKEQGQDPDKLRFGELSEKGYSLKGEEAWNKYMKDWKDGKGKASNGHFLLLDTEFPITSFSSLPPLPAETELRVLDLSNPPANGSITIRYEGEQVQTHYNSSQTATTVAYAIYGNINQSPDIQLTAVIPSPGTLVLTEKRDGCEYNGNMVTVSESQGTHIGLNSDTFMMAGGEDVEGCQDPVPPPPPGPEITISWGSKISTPPFDYGWVDMWSYTWASEPIYYVDVIGVSQRDFTIINSGQDGGYNRSYAIVGASEYKQPFDPESLWQQSGDHLFGFSPAEGYRATSYARETF